MGGNMREDWLMRNLLFGGQTFDWLTVLSLFIVGGFMVLPALQGQQLSGRARACFLGTTWVLVVKLFVHLVQILLLNLDMFNNTVNWLSQSEERISVRPKDTTPRQLTMTEQQQSLIAWSTPISPCASPTPLWRRSSATTTGS